MNNQHGFTLVEVAISMAILSVTMMVATMGFISIVRLQEKAESVRNVQQTTRYALETITRDVRNANTYSLSDNGRQILLPNALTPSAQVRYTYIVDDGIYRVQCGVSCPTSATAGENLTSGVIRVIDFELEVIATGSSATSPLRLYMRSAQPQAGLVETDPYYYEYETTTTVVPRR
ncbi:MAG: prepilin-type N-terminal cleavage/methylation domain-containing protein [Candidatus Saccharimonadales bacterium]